MTFWAIYNDLFPPVGHPKWWFSRGSHPPQNGRNIQVKDLFHKLPRLTFKCLCKKPRCYFSNPQVVVFRSSALTVLCDLCESCKWKNDRFWLTTLLVSNPNPYNTPASLMMWESLEMLLGMGRNLRAAKGKLLLQRSVPWAIHSDFKLFLLKSGFSWDLRLKGQPNNIGSQQIHDQTEVRNTDHSSSRWWFHFFFIFHPYLGKISNLTNIFQMG